MPKVSYFLKILIISPFFLSACGQGGTQGPEAGSPEALKAQGMQCFQDGDASCAESNFCAVDEDRKASLRCCLAQLAGVAFSENTQKLGLALGYQPLSLKEIREMSHEEILDQKAIPFADLFLIPNEETIDYQKLFTGWFLALSEAEVSTQELNTRLRTLGAGLEGSLTCLNEKLSYFKNDELQEGIFKTEEKISVLKRDVLFAKFFLGLTAYGLQTVPLYEWGFDHFPPVPPSDNFFVDLNGGAGEGDERFGDLSDENARMFSDKFPLLVKSLDSLKAFTALVDHPGKVDAYLNWRLSEEEQKYLSKILSAAYLSIKQNQWFLLPGDETMVNLFSLSQARKIPNGRQVSREIPVLKKDESGNWAKNREFFSEFFFPVLREATSAPEVR